MSETESDGTGPRTDGRERVLGRVLIGLLLLILGVGTAVQSIVTSQHVGQLQQCQARYANRFAKALDTRTEVSNGSQRALDGLVTAISEHPDDRKATSAALENYLQQRRMAKQQREQNPYPDPPREACG